MANRIMFAAPASDSGKTIVTCAFLQAVSDKGLSPAAFKCGPDFIDPMFHTAVLGVPSRNLDLFFCAPAEVRALVSRHTQGRDIAVMEGVMGFYDGIAATPDASSYHLARETGTPAILVVSPKGASLSLAACLRGLRDFRPDNTLRGILLNRCGERYFRYLAPILERECGLPVVGYLPELGEAQIKSRHLGLVPAAEIPLLREKLSAVAQQMTRTVDLDRILSIAASADGLPVPAGPPPPPPGGPLVAVARDPAFCLYYQDNLDLLTALGARLIEFSPIKDAALPEAASALYLGGGYPELHARELSANESMRQSIYAAVGAGLPTIAEGGGFQYLQEAIVDAEGASRPMAGAVPSTSAPASHGRFGYITLTAQRDTMLCAAGESIPAHEFHRWDSTVTGDAFTAEKPHSKATWPCVVATGNLFAGYPHLYLPASPNFAKRFLAAANSFREERQSWQNPL